MSRSRFTALLVALLAVACRDAETTAPDEWTDVRPQAVEVGSIASQLGGADVETSEATRYLSFPASTDCLGAVRIVGTLRWVDRLVTQPDGSRHLTEIMDASGIEIVQGASRWLPTPNASEIFVINFSPEGVQLQTEHVGVVVYRSDDRPSLRLVHHIHTVRAPDGSITTNHGGFGITCIAPER